MKIALLNNRRNLEFLLNAFTDSDRLTLRLLSGFSGRTDYLLPCYLPLTKHFSGLQPTDDDLQIRVSISAQSLKSAVAHRG